MATEKRHKRDDFWVRQLTLADPEEPGLAGPTIEGSSDGASVILTNRAGTAVTLNATELGFTDGVTAGTVTASKAAVVDSNKDIGDFRNVDVTNLDAGASGTAGTVDVFPTTAAKGKIQIAAADSAGDTTTTITNAPQAGARTYTIPDAGASAAFVMTAGTQTLSGVTTLALVGGVTLNSTAVLSKTSAYPLVAADSGRHFDNTGAGGSVTFTLPAVATSVGFTAYFHCVVDQEIVIAAPAGTLVGPNNAGRTTATLAGAGNRIGVDIMAFCNGAKWFLSVDVKGLTAPTYA